MRKKEVITGKEYQTIIMTIKTMTKQRENQINVSNTGTQLIKRSVNLKVVTLNILRGVVLMKILR